MSDIKDISSAVNGYFIKIEGASGSIDDISLLLEEDGKTERFKKNVALSS